MAHVDCDTISFLGVGDAFALFDHFAPDHYRSLDPERDRHDRRPVRRYAMGAAYTEGASRTGRHRLRP